MTDLKTLYRQAIVGRVAELEAELSSMSSGSESEDALRRIAHSLRGSGATYGFPEVSEAAALVEDANANELQPLTRDLVRVLRAVIDGGPKPARVLLVDDDPEILLLLRTVLAAQNRELTSVENGADAITAVRGSAFTLIVLDLLLPDMDGRDVLKEIRSDQRYALAPVIVLSAKTTPMTKRECEALGATAFFEKPFDPEAVAAAVGAQLQRAADIEAETSP
jgi:CheY-like chemotaxis protein